MKAAFVFHPAADAELDDILRYTRREWGAKQAKAYAAKLRRCVEAIAAGKRPFKDMSQIYPGMRMSRCEHHYVFCILRQDAPMLVLAILHERMDLMARLADRLK